MKPISSMPGKFSSAALMIPKIYYWIADSLFGELLRIQIESFYNIFHLRLKCPQNACNPITFLN
jgi:hypothetical protein